jgi:hypothetical protein
MFGCEGNSRNRDAPSRSELVTMRRAAKTLSANAVGGVRSLNLSRETTRVEYTKRTGGWWREGEGGTDTTRFDFLDWQDVASMMAVSQVKLEFHGCKSGFRNTP